METLVHAFDHRQALGELRRVLRPGGTLALFEYSVPPRSQMTAEQREAFDFVVERSTMRSLPAFVHGAFPAILDEAGLAAVLNSMALVEGYRHREAGATTWCGPGGP
jgi:SAM-dependent methyltransferase